MHGRSVSGLAAILFSFPALAQEVDPAIGRRLAETVCFECHQVEANPTAPSRNPDAPRFADVARMPSTTDLSIKVFLRSSHAAMPNFMLSPEEIDSLTSYILGLRRR